MRLQDISKTSLRSLTPLANRLNWKFTAPVFIGDTITAEAEVLSVHDTKPVTQLKFNVTRGDGETVLEGEAWCYTLSSRESTS